MSERKSERKKNCAQLQRRTDFNPLQKTSRRAKAPRPAAREGKGYRPRSLRKQEAARPLRATQGTPAMCGSLAMKKSRIFSGGAPGLRDALSLRQFSTSPGSPPPDRTGGTGPGLRDALSLRQYSTSPGSPPPDRTGGTGPGLRDALSLRRFSTSPGSPPQRSPPPDRAGGTGPGLRDALSLRQFSTSPGSPPPDRTGGTGPGLRDALSLRQFSTSPGSPPRLTSARSNWRHGTGAATRSVPAAV